MDLASRRLKAMKIERLLPLDRLEPGFRLLEVGCGAGGISSYFATHPQWRCQVDAVDVVDKRLIMDGFSFQLVRDTHLPFANACFDVVLTNHVIEHVGDRRAQLHHLHEVHRVLKPTGVGYLAVPNRWQLVEPHYQLAFLSWIPHGLRTPYLRWSGKGTHYDCEPLEMGELETLLSEAGFGYENLCLEAMQQMISIEGSKSLALRAAIRLPEQLQSLLRPIIPTLIYRLSPNGN